MTYTEALKYRQMIVKGSASLSDEDALEVPMLYDAWAVGVRYEVKEVDGKLVKPRFVYNGDLYRVEQTHTSQEDWLPDATPALYTKIIEGDDGIEVWKKPTGAHDAYNLGDKVHYPEKQSPVYVSKMNGNIWSPDELPDQWDLWDGE